MSTLLVTVVGPMLQRDLSLPAGVAVGELLPTLVEVVGCGAAEDADWALSPDEGEPFARYTSLADNDVRDGAVLHLRVAEKPGPGSVWQQAKEWETKPLVARTQLLLPRPSPVWRRVGATLATALGRPSQEAPGPPWHHPGEVPWPAETLNGETPPPTPSALTVPTRTRLSERVRDTWRSSNYLERLNAAINAPRLRRCVTIAVVSPKGGVGKTTITALLGTLLALVRADRIVAVDTNPDFGSLGRILTPHHSLFVDDLLEEVERSTLTLTSLDGFLGRAAHGLMVLPAPTDVERMEKLDEAAYRTVIERLMDFVGVVLLDCGTGMHEPAARAAMASADQLVLVTDAEPSTASLVAEAGALLTRTHRPITVVVNKAPRRSSRLNIDRLGEFVPKARGMVVIPTHAQAATKLSLGAFDWRDAPGNWQRILRELAVVLVSDWRRLGLTLR